MNLGRFLSELRRRRVFRVAIAYCAVAWLVIEVTSTIVPGLELPAWIVRAVILLALAGLPLALLLAWVLDITPRGLEVTGDDDALAEGSPHAAAGVSRSVFLASIAGILILAGTLSLFQLHRASEQASDLANLRLLEVRQLADGKNYLGAYDLLTGVEDAITVPGNLDSLWFEISDRLSITTEPPGARVEGRIIDDTGDVAASEPMFLGVTPISDLSIPRSDLLLRISLDGYAAVERIATSGLTRQGNSKGPGIDLSVELVADEEMPENAVFVPGGEYHLVSSDMPAALSAILDPYFIDAFEVSNARFKEFVDAGGYREPAIWPDDIAAGDGAIRLDVLLESLIDETGSHAPRTWQRGNPPEGQGNHPVTGVSWYEAYAYCRFRGKRLPSVYQWEKAARDGRITIYGGNVMPWGYADPGSPQQGRSNFSSDGTLPVDAQPAGMSPYGAFAMAGNVKEWVMNGALDGKMLTGGSWEDPAYLFSKFNHYPPATSTRSLGFRCAEVRSDDARRFRDQGDKVIDRSNVTPSYETVDESDYARLLSFYRYDKRPLRAEVIETIETKDWVREKLTYAGPQNDRVLAYLWLPKSAAPPYQTLVFIPGSDTFFSTRVDQAAERFVSGHVLSGRAVFAVVMKGMLEREWGPDFHLPATNSVEFRDLMVRHATELRLGMDYLETRNDIDATRLAYVGVSLSAGSRLPWAAIDNRYKAVILIGGGIDERVKPTLPEADNVNFAPYIRPPKLLLNGKQDDEHPWLTRGLPLWNLLREPKQLVLFDGAGHVPDRERRLPVEQAFLDEHLGPLR